MNSIIKCHSLISRNVWKPRVALRFNSDKKVDLKLGGAHRVDNLERKFLVWTGKYKTVEEVPDLVPPDVMERCRNRMRIKIANYMMAATIIACLGMVYVGKKKREKGETVESINLRWHQQYKEEEEARAKADKS